MTGGVFKGADIDRLSTATTTTSSDFQLIVQAGVASKATAADASQALGIASTAVVFADTDSSLKGDITKISYNDGVDAFQAGSSGNRGRVDIYSSSSAKGKMRFEATANSTDNTTTITNAAQAATRTYTIPDAGASASFLMTQGAQAIVGAQTFTVLTRFTDAAVGGTTAGTGITVIHTPGKSVFTLVDFALTVTDSGANGGHGAFTFFTFPEGHIRVESGLATFTKFSAQGTSQADSGVCDIGVGTTATATDNEVLSTTEQNIVTKIDTTLDGSGDLSGTVNSTINSTAAAFDGASTAIICSLNCAITAATISATEIFDVSGTITINWTDMGDT